LDKGTRYNAQGSKIKTPRQLTGMGTKKLNKEKAQGIEVWRSIPSYFLLGL
jgi:hypothetical protein